MITDVHGIRAGHWTDHQALTGCTVILLPEATVASGEVRGGAPGTREWALLSPQAGVAQVNAVVLAGGSAFGLAACDGVVRYCEENGMGVPTPAGPVPIVVGAVIYDLGVGQASVRPGPNQGYAAAAAAYSGALALGQVGAGTGATVNKWLGPDEVRAGGIGSATESHGDLVVSALVVVNAVGDLVDRSPTTRAKPDEQGRPRVWPEGAALPTWGAGGRANTTIGLIATNARLDKAACLVLAQSGHDGMARGLEPVHTAFDGDALVAAATGEVQAQVEQVRLLGARAVEGAIRSALGGAATGASL
ncbi:MAG: P1 family peptidase [Acidimicrobiales bacterium]